MATFTITSLNEAVRLYVRARYISEGLSPGGVKLGGTLSTIGEMPQFGKKTQKELSKIARQRKRKQEQETELSPELRESFKSSETFTSDELASLRLRAVQALGHARKQLGASAHYCGAMIRLEDDCDRLCKENPIYEEINNDKETVRL